MSDMTDESGAYLIPAIPAGTYTVRASATGFDAQTIDWPVQSEGVTNLDFQLYPADDSLLGDVNEDGSVNAVDVQLVINAVLGINIGALDPDINNDDATNAVDVQLVINAVLGIPIGPF